MICFSIVITSVAKIKYHQSEKICSLPLFVTRVTWLVPHVEQELLTLPEHLSWPQFLVGFLLLDLFCNVVRVSSSTHGFWLSLWYLQSVLNIIQNFVWTEKKPQQDWGWWVVFRCSSKTDFHLNKYISYQNQNNSWKP